MFQDYIGIGFVLFPFHALSVYPVLTMNCQETTSNTARIPLVVIVAILCRNFTQLPIIPWVIGMEHDGGCYCCSFLHFQGYHHSVRVETALACLAARALRMSCPYRGVYRNSGSSRCQAKCCSSSQKACHRRGREYCSSPLMVGRCSSQHPWEMLYDVDDCKNVVVVVDAVVAALVRDAAVMAVVVVEFDTVVKSMLEAVSAAADAVVARGGIVEIERAVLDKNRSWVNVVLEV